METKQCSKCKTIRDVTLFGRDPKNSDGLKSWCNPCMTAAAGAYQKAHPEKKRLADQRYYQKNKEKSRQNGKKWRIENKERYKENNKKYYIEHKDTIISKVRKWYKDNAEKVKVSSAEYRKKNADFIKKIKSEYSKNNQGVRRATEQKRRALKKKSSGKYTYKEFSDLCKRFGNKCLMCNRTDVKLTVDHVIPLSKGGDNTIDNIQPLCLSCNSKKHNKIIDFRY